MLAADVFSESGDRVVLAHGFTQNAQCWGGFGRMLSARFSVLAIDAPGHGTSAHDDVDLVEAGRLLVEAGGYGHYIGYSMGGRMLLHAALGDRLGAMASLVLIGATAGIADEAARVERMAADNKLADRIVELGTETFIDHWLQKPIFAGLASDQAERSARMANRAEGLAASLRNCGTGTQQPLWDQLSSLSLPVLIIAGHLDSKFTKIGAAMAEAIGPNAVFQAVEGGHAVQLENPAGTAAAVSSWLSQQ